MKLSLISFTRQGGLLCQTLFYGFLREGHDCEAFCMPKYAEECGLVPLEESLGEWCGSRFSQADALVYAIFHVLEWTFLNFPPFSVFLAIFHVLKCVFLIFRDFQFSRQDRKSVV